MRIYVIISYFNVDEFRSGNEEAVDNRQCENDDDEDNQQMDTVQREVQHLSLPVNSTTTGSSNDANSKDGSQPILDDNPLGNTDVSLVHICTIEKYLSD